MMMISNGHRNASHRRGSRVEFMMVVMMSRRSRLVAEVGRIRAHQQIGLVLCVDGRSRCRVNHRRGRCHRGRSCIGGARRWLVELRQAVKVELVGVPLAVDLRHDVLVVVVAESARQLVVVHVRLRFAFAPFASHFIWVDKLKLSVCTLPTDYA